MQDKPVRKFYYYVYYTEHGSIYNRRFIVADHVLWHWAQYWRDYYRANFGVDCEIELEKQR